MKHHIVVLTDGVNPETNTYWYIHHEDTIDFQKAWNQVMFKALKENFEGPITDIPLQWFYEEHLYPETDTTVSIITNNHLHPTRAYETAGLYPVSCADCYRYENGVCTKYGGYVDSTTDCDDCIHADNIYHLLHKDIIVATFLADTGVNIDDMTPAQIAELLRSPEFPNIPDTYAEKDLEIHTIEIV